jgi:hypothetical protein
VSKIRILSIALCLTGLLWAPILAATPQAATNFTGTWQMTVNGGGRGGGQGGGSGEGRGGGRGQRGGSQTLSITQDGDKVKVDHKTPREEQTSDATVSGNTISWTEERQGRDGNSIKIAYKAMIDGDTLTGTMGTGRFNRDFTAKQSN